jgi:predicted DNA-binding protein
MNKAVQIRMPMAVWDHLSKLAEQRAPGTKVTSLIREAIHEVYFDRPPNGKNSDRSKKNGP